MLTKEGTLSLRLPDADRAAFLEQYRTSLTVQCGHVMPEYVDVPDALLSDTRLLERFVAISREYARSLKPKATTRPKTATQKHRR